MTDSSISFDSAKRRFFQYWLGATMTNGDKSPGWISNNQLIDSSSVTWMDKDYLFAPKGNISCVIIDIYENPYQWIAKAYNFTLPMHGQDFM